MKILRSDIYENLRMALSTLILAGFLISVLSLFLKTSPVDSEHRDMLLSPEEREANRSMMVCVSRARSQRIVLDV